MSGRERFSAWLFGRVVATERGMFWQPQGRDFRFRYDAFPAGAAGEKRCGRMFFGE